MGLLEGKVAIISGAARGQGRSHAVRLAEEGADIVAFDICENVAACPWDLASEEELAETVKLVEALDRRIVARKVDVRDVEGVEQLVADGVAELGRLDIVVANAGIMSYGHSWELDHATWRETIDINLTGAWNLVRASLPTMREAGRGGSIVLTSSSAAHIGLPNLVHYASAKAGLVGMMQVLATELGPDMIRVNTIHPTGVGTKMLRNEVTYEVFLGGANLVPGEAFSPESEESVQAAMKGLNSMPIPWIEPVDISNAIVYLTSELGRYVSGTQFRVDAGSASK